MTEESWYLAGPMTGYPEWNFPAFHAAAAKLRADGLRVVNPAEITPDVGTPRHICLKADIAQLIHCTGVAFLPGWERSKGAQLEAHIAAELEMKIIYL